MGESIKSLREAYEAARDECNAAAKVARRTGASADKAAVEPLKAKKKAAFLAWKEAENDVKHGRREADPGDAPEAVAVPADEEPAKPTRGRRSKKAKA
jgi:hypothetical protein